MAHGFRYVPHRRTAGAAPARSQRCPWCSLYHGSGLCLSYGTYVAPTAAIPLDVPDESVGRLLQAIFAAPEHGGPPYTHTLKLPETEEEMRAGVEAPLFTVEEGP